MFHAAALCDWRSQPLLLQRASAGQGLEAAVIESPAEKPPGNPIRSEAGAQRLNLAKLREWEDLKYGMFLHFGIDTYVVGKPYPDTLDGTTPASVYNPDKLDVDQSIQIARDAGMKYAVLTAKHHQGFAFGRAASRALP